MRNITHMKDQISAQDFFKRRTEGSYQFGWQIRDKAHSIGHDDFKSGLPKRHFAHSWIERCEKHIFCKNIRACKTVKERRFAGIGIPD